MKFNKWTLGLAAVGAVSLVSVAQAEEKGSTVMTALSSTILSGYVDTSAQWNIGTGNSHAPAYKYGGSTKADGFNLNAVKVTLEKPLDEAEWAAGYKTDLLFGPDANLFPLGIGTTSTGAAISDFAIKQAYVALRAPVGNGLDFKMGVFDSIIGYESTESVNNPNFSRSWGHTFEPSTHTGLLSTYRLNNNVAFAAGIANTESAIINSRAFPTVNPATSGFQAESYKTYMGSIALTAPDDWGFISGSSLYGGVVNGFNNNQQANQTSWYAGATVATPVTGLRVGASYDYEGISEQPDRNPFALPGTRIPSAYANAVALYTSFQATEKLSLHLRGEWATMSKSLASNFQANNFGVASKMVSLTGTVQYDLWKNVISRLEVRWDHAADGSNAFGGDGPNQTNSTGGLASTGNRHNSYIVAANLIYKF
jgi:Putative beta-barrel porin-2, OmpL-like. bbp2